MVQRVLPHYRIPFFNKLQYNLADHGIRLRLIYGQEYQGTVPKTVCLSEPWTFKVQNAYLKVQDMELVWQSCIKNLRGSDLIIVEQANRLLVNYLLLAGFVAKGAKIAYWGHGKNWQSAKADSLREIFKRSMISKVDWWFAYTELSAQRVVESGFPKDKVTIVNNSIDTISLAAACNDMRDEDILKVRKETGINSQNVCVYCGSMYQDKKIDFLIEACILLRNAMKDFHMIFIGDGPEQHLIADACARHPWMHYVGPKFGREKVPYLKAAKAILMPGLVGLVLIDSFVSGVPLITTDFPYHSPEICYLENNKNGIITDFELNAYVGEVAHYLRSPDKQDQLKKGCAESAAFYSIDNMVNNFSSGVVTCLSSIN